MPTTVTIDSVTTGDAAPTTAPYKVSDKAGYDTWSYQATPTHDGAIVPTSDALPSEGSIYPDEGWCPDDALMVADRGAMIPGVPRDIVGWILREGGSGPTSGKLVEQVTNRCSVNRACGSRASMAVSARGTRVAPGDHIAASHTFTDINDGGADGTRSINVYVLTENQGWS